MSQLPNAGNYRNGTQKTHQAASSSASASAGPRPRRTPPANNATNELNINEVSIFIALFLALATIVFVLLDMPWYAVGLATITGGIIGALLNN